MAAHRERLIGSTNLMNDSSGKNPRAHNLGGASGKRLLKIGVA
jgi:hypothetical protein